MDGSSRRDFLLQSLSGVALASAGGFALAATGHAQAGDAPARIVLTRANNDSDLVFLSGAAALDLYHRHPHVDRDEILPDDIGAQTHMTLRNIYEVLRVAGLEWENVLSLLRYQKDIGHTGEIDAVIAQYFDDWRPAMSAVQIDSLSAPSSLLEIEAIALMPTQTPAASQQENRMTGLDVIQTRPDLAETTIFAPGIRVAAGNDLIFLSGITARPFDDAPGFAMPEGFDAQAEMATRHIDAMLNQLGAKKTDIVRIVTFYTRDFNGRIMGRYLEGWRPCSSAIGIRALPVAGAEVMYDLVISAPSGG